MCSGSTHAPTNCLILSWFNSFSCTDKFMMTHKTGCRWAAATICPAPLLPRGRRSAEITISSYLFARWHLFRHVGYFRHQQQVDLLILKVVTESRVTWATSAPILLFLSFSGQRDGHLSFVTTCHSVRCWMFSLVILWCGLIVFFFLKQYSKIQIRYYLVSLRWRYTTVIIQLIRPTTLTADWLTVT